MDTQPVVQKIVDDEGRRTLIAFSKFIRTFENSEGQKIYMEQIVELTSPERDTLQVDFLHINAHSAVLASTIELQFYRLYHFLCTAIRDVVVQSCNDEALQQQLSKKEFYLGIVGIKYKHQVRHLTSDKIGKLVRISGQVVRAAPVHPELSIGTFVCDDCGLTIHNVVQQFKYTQPLKCDNKQCQNRTRFLLNIYDSQFVDFQRLRIQETHDELPLGSVPRNIDVIIRGEAVESAQPGDHCDFLGTLIVVPDVSMLSAPGVRAQPKTHTRLRDQMNDRFNLKGLKSLGVRELSYKLAFLACTITPSNPTFGGIDFSHEEVSATDLWSSLLPEDQEKLKNMSEDREIVNRLCNGLFPNIYGNKEVKLGILLQLFGGVAKKIPGSTLRGDINICLVGDPSCGKSQFLKTIEKFSQRVIYTSGKASSAAGLTAAVVKDEESFDFVIEAGALMLADNGICCIDEFDKMDVKDQVAIHEAMEQQTISITKAGVKATLNARCSILAAANPNGGRYETNQPLKHNINFSGPIISRFDLFFILIDTNDNPVVDYEIAKRILETHRRVQGHTKPDTVYTVDDIRKYIMFARCFKPQISEEAERYLKTAYLKLRLNNDYHSTRITVRQLESLIRLSEAYARLKCASQVEEEHVKQAHDLLSKSIIRISSSEVDLDEELDDYDLLNGNVQSPFNDITNDANNINGVAVDGEPMEVEDRESGGLANGNMDSTSVKKTEQSFLKIPHERYTDIKNSLVHHLRKEEDQNSDNPEWEGVRKSQLVEWYMEKIESELESEEDYKVRKEVIERMITRLLRDKVLIKPEEREDDEGDPCIFIHPNYVSE